VLNGKVTLVLKGFSVIVMNCHFDVGIDIKREHLRYHQSRAELGPMPSWVVWMVTRESLGSGWRPGEGLAPV